MADSISTGAELRRLDQRTSLASYLSAIWDRRDFLIVVPREDLRAQNTTTVFGQAWTLLNPALMTLVYYLIFGLVLDARRGVEFYIAYLTSGLLMFRFCQQGVTRAAAVIDNNLGLIRSIQFPKALLTIAIVIEQLLAFVPAMLVMVVVALLNGAPLAPRMLLLPGAVMVLAVFTLGLALFAARIGSRVADLREILPHLFRILLYVSGVLFSVERLIENDVVRVILQINPIHEALMLGRWALLGTEFEAWMGAALAAWTVVTPIVGFLYFKGGENQYGSPSR